MDRKNLESYTLNSRLEQSIKSTKEFFERTIDEEYIAEWLSSLSEPEPIEKSLNTFSVLVFRLGKEWLALTASCCKEITRRRQVHIIPHRTGKILQGVVNINGKLELYVALHELLQIETSIAFHTERLPYQRNRMLVILRDGEIWTFPVDELKGLYEWNLLEMEKAPVNVSKSTVNYIKGMMEVDDKNIGLLDEELLFAGLKRSLP